MDKIWKNCIGNFFKMDKIWIICIGNFLKQGNTAIALFKRNYSTKFLS